MQIRLAIPSDADTLYRLHVASIERLCANDYTPQQIRSWVGCKHPDHYRRFMSDGEVYYLAVADDDQPIGLASFKSDHLTSLYVTDSVGKGVDSALLTAVESDLRRRGITTLNTDATLTSLSFYRKRGYQQHEQRLFRLPDGVELPCVRMTKSLAGSPLTLRPATPDDAPRIHAIHADALRLLCAKDYTPAQIDSWVRFRSVDDYRRALIAGEANWVATLNDELVGYATYVPGELTALFVDPTFAGLGTGRLLLAHTESHAAHQGLHELTLQSTKTAKAFYTRAGYVAGDDQLYRLPDGTEIACTHMRKSLI